MTELKLEKTLFIHLWFPDIFGFKGGIQTYCSFFLQAIQNIYPNADYHVFLKNDRQANYTLLSKAQTTFYYSGNIPSPLRTFYFATSLFISALIQRPNFIIMGHLNFSPVAHWLKHLTGIPYGVVAHGVDAWNLQNPYIIQALQHADLVLPVSHYTGDRLLQEQALNPQKISVLPNTFNYHQFQIASKSPSLLSKYELSPEQPVILTVTRLAGTERYKGYDQILQALPIIRQQIPNVHYMLVGKGDDQPRIEQLIKELRLGDCVTLTGFIPDQELCDYYNLCDVFAMPSKREGFGIVYLEAMVCGKPTLGGNQDGATDALCNGELGVLVNPDNIPEIAETLIAILQGTYPHHLIYQPQALREKVIEKFGFEKFQQTLANLLTEHFV